MPADMSRSCRSSAMAPGDNVGQRRPGGGAHAGRLLGRQHAGQAGAPGRPVPHKGAAAALPRRQPNELGGLAPVRLLCFNMTVIL